MKQKLLFILTLLLCVCSGAWAQETFTFAWTSNGTAGYSYSQAGPTGGELIANNAIYFVSNQGPKADASKLNPYRVGFVFKPTTNVTVKIKGSAGSSARTIQDIKIDEQVDERFYSLCKDAVGSNKTVMQYALDNASDENKDFFKTVGLLKVSKGVYSVAGDAKSASGETAQASLYDNRTAANNISISANSENEEILNTGTPASNFTFEAGNVYRIYMTTSSSTGTQLISFTFSSAAVKKSTTTTINVPEGFNKDIKNGKTAGTLTATVTPEGEDALVSPAITWSSSNKDVADITSAGVVTLKTEGTTTITASYAGDETYAASSAEYSLTVTDSRTEITPSLTYDNTTLILGQTTTATPTLTGNTGNGDVTYSSDDTSVATVDADGVVTAVTVGTAHITANIAATSDYRAGSAQATITVANNPLGSKSITWTLSPINSANAELTSTSESTSIYLKNIDEINHSKVSLNSSPSKASNRTAKVDRTVGKDNDKYVYVTFDVEDGYYFIPSSISIKVANVSNVTTFDAELIDENDVTVGESEKTFNSTDGTVETWVINNSDNGKAMSGTVTLKIYGYAETAGTYRFGNQIVIEGNVTRVVPVTISAAKYATFASDYDLDFSSVDGLYAYTATASSNTITFNKVTGSVKAGDGLLLYADVNTATTFNVPVATNNPSAVEGNKLVRGTGEAVSTDGTTSGSYNYVLSNNGGVIAFYYANGKTVDTNKAYLKDITASASKISLPFNDDETTAIDNITISQYDNDAPMYNMAGQRVSESYKGVVIQNGKKYIRK